MDATPSQIREIMVRLQRDYLAQMKPHIAEFRRMKALMEKKALPDPDFRELYRLSHDFAGSGETFGFPDISRTARTLHLAIKALRDAGRADAAQDLALLAHFGAFEAALDAAQAKTLQEAEEGLVIPEAPELAPAKESSDVYFMADTQEEVATLAAQIGYFGYNVIVNAKPEVARAALEDGSAKAAVFFSAMKEKDVSFIRSVAAGTIRPGGAAVPVIIVCPQGDFDTRLSAARLGAQGFFEKETDALQLTERIEELSHKFMDPPRYNIMIVDDDVMLTEFYNHSLTRTGMSVMTLTDPKKAIEALSRQQIDLILIDFSMPGCNGQELAAVIRQHPRHVSLPIVFISSYDDLERTLVDTGLGIDDFLVKPFTADRLYSVVRNRAQRAAELKSFMTRDSFTGLFNHSYFNETLGNELARVRRGKRETSYAMLDLDHFKSINDTYGHAAGDQVIKSFSRMLQQHLRRSDIIGRCGGEEFGVILPECPMPKAMEILEKIRKSFAEATFTFNNITVHVTFSGGLVRVDPENDIDHLMKCADAALYKAKHQGRNRILTFED